MINSKALSTEGGLTISKVTEVDAEGNILSTSYWVHTLNGTPKIFSSIEDAEEYRESFLKLPEPPSGDSGPSM